MRRIILFLLSTIVSASNICGFKDKGNSRDRVFNASMKDQSVETIFNNYVDNQEEVFLHNYATTYFSNLKSRFGINSHETCSFVAAECSYLFSTLIGTMILLTILCGRSF